MKDLLLIILCFSSQYIFSQHVKDSEEIKTEILEHQNQIDSLNFILEDLELAQIHEELSSYFLPKIDSLEELIAHRALFLVYDEKHEQAKWVLHKISTNIIEGKVSRTNDFRKDTLIKSGSAEEKDYFLKTKNELGKYEYDGYGYDRGHLAPSADFRWSQRALSESYFYSNMSPQLPTFNREIWADLEGLVRSYVYENKRPLIVYTGPVLKDNLKKQERSINGVSIPEEFYKVVVDFEARKGIAYILPQVGSKDYPVEYFATTIDEVESITGIDFLHQIDDETEASIERQKEINDWLPENQKRDVPPIKVGSLGKAKFNTVQANLFVDSGEKKEICGSVVSTHYSKNKHTFINLDKAFPNQIFSITIWNSNHHNFSYEPHIELLNKKVCVKGKITDNKGVPTMNLENERAITFMD
ncbi:MAG: DNA/RNA non-specific endonuclease [Bacteroidota bacterium]|nr:DNA/RNA non-specific endonuclease [Bacteroidota bacterium]